MEKTFHPKASELNHDWVVVDAAGKNLGRFSSEVAKVLLGKHKPDYTPGVDNGDFVVVVNCEQIKVTGGKLDDKRYYRHTGYPGGIREITLRDQLKKHPERVIEAAVWGMLPKNKYGRKLMKKLRIYAGAEHPHAAQNPKSLDI